MDELINKIINKKLKFDNEESFKELYNDALEIINIGENEISLATDENKYLIKKSISKKFFNLYNLLESLSTVVVNDSAKEKLFAISKMFYRAWDRNIKYYK